MAVLLCTLFYKNRTDHPDVRRLLEAFGGPLQFFGVLSPDAFKIDEPWRVVELSCGTTTVTLGGPNSGRLLATVVLARRYRARKAIELKRRPDLMTLLDPDSELNRGERLSMIEALRCDPELKADFAKLEQLATDANTENLERAVVAHLMFEELLRYHDWSDPEEILSDQVPFAGLLAIANARIARDQKEPARVCSRALRLPSRARCMDSVAHTATPVGIRGWRRHSSHAAIRQAGLVNCRRPTTSARGRPIRTR